jgi:hypothetical protein
MYLWQVSTGKMDQKSYIGDLLILTAKMCGVPVNHWQSLAKIHSREINPRKNSEMRGHREGQVWGQAISLS